jgi:hypothetical protein
MFWLNHLNNAGSVNICYVLGGETVGEF